MKDRLRMAGWAAIAAGAMLFATQAVAAKGAKGGADKATLARGKYLVTVGGCNDCHTPWKMGEKGPEPDMSKMLMGHPADMQLPPPPAAQGPWIVSGAATMTAWAGPWGISYAANLTSDAETGLGKWTEQNFVEALRTGRHMGRGRPILPPMPWPNMAQASDADLKAIFAFLLTVPPISNRVPEPTPPASAAGGVGSGAGTAPADSAEGTAPPEGPPAGGAAPPKPTP